MSGLQRSVAPTDYLHGYFNDVAVGVRERRSWESADELLGALEAQGGVQVAFEPYFHEGPRGEVCPVAPVDCEQPSVSPSAETHTNGAYFTHAQHLGQQLKVLLAQAITNPPAFK